MLPSDIVFIALAGGTVTLYETMTYFDVEPGTVCEAEEEHSNGVQVEQAKLKEATTYSDVAPGAVCEVEEEYSNGVQVEQAKLKFSTLAAIPTNEPLAFVFITMNGEQLLIGAREKPHATVKVASTTGQTDGDASIKSYTVTFKARKALVRYEVYNAL
jgi:hypothetical protein